MFSRRFWLLFALVIAVVTIFVFLIWPGWSYQWDWTGFGASKSPIKNPKAPFDYYPSKTLWDWLQLLVIPLAVVGVGYLLNRAQQRREQDVAEKNRVQDLEVAQNREQEMVIETYLAQMAKLLLQTGLSEPDSDKGIGAQQLARVQTLTALRRLDGSRRRTIVEFLYEARLIGYLYRAAEDDPPEEKPAIIDLSGADLRGADLAGIDLAHADLRRANLNRANLSYAYLYRVRLYEADLRGANLGNANLGNANLYGANLGAADLSVADLSVADLSVADLSAADLSAADLSAADLYKVDLTGAVLSKAKLYSTNLRQAIVTNEQLNNAKSLAKATLPNGTKLPKDFKGPLSFTDG